jgi:hypothetical protein
VRSLSDPDSPPATTIIPPEPENAQTRHFPQGRTGGPR